MKNIFKLKVRNSIKNMLIISLFLYIFCSMKYENMILSNVNDILVNVVDTLHHDIKIEHETMKACENGILKEYRIKKLEELGRAMSRG